MRADQSLSQHYHLLLGLDKDWEVQEVNLSLELTLALVPQFGL